MRLRGMRLLIIWAISAALLIPATANAAHVPRLLAAESCRVAGKVIHREYTNIIPGSSRGGCFTQRHPWRPNIRMVDIYYLDRARNEWKTTITIRKTWTGYRYRILADLRV
jgi:hypothetical protein